MVCKEYFYKLSQCKIYIVTVPTPVDSRNNPDLKHLREATKSIANVLSKGSLVIYESTVFPGATEEVCVPILEKYSKLTYNKDFYCGYSPERINPGDSSRKLPSIKKIAMRKLSATVTHLHRVCVRCWSDQSVRWEVSAYFDDGSGGALVYFDGVQSIELLQITRAVRLELESLCRETAHELDYTPARISVGPPKGKDGAKGALDPNERLLRHIQSSFESRKLVCFCRPLHERNFKPETQARVVSIQVNDSPHDSLRNFAPKLKCFRLEVVHHAIEGYENLKNLL